MKVKEFFIDMAKGAAIGIAMIIPGVSGGTLAVLLKIYDKMIDAIGNLRKHFIKSVLYLLPIALGMIIAFAAAYVPLNLALEYAPFPTVLLFAGLMTGTCPKLFSDCREKGFKSLDAIAIIVPLIAVIGICFIPGAGEADLSATMQWYGYILIVLVGVAASCALVVPGISGSMLLMIFGYYKPVLELFKQILVDPLHSLGVLALFAVGLLVGFFTIAKLMQYLLKRFPRVTGWAIFGFVIGSLPAIVVTFFNQYGTEPQFLTSLHIALGVSLFVLGGVASFVLTYFMEKFAKRKEAEALPTAALPAPSPENDGAVVNDARHEVADCGGNANAENNPNEAEIKADYNDANENPPTA